LPRSYIRVTIISPPSGSTSPHRYPLSGGGYCFLSTVRVEPWTLEGDGGRGPAARHRLVAISTHRRNDLSVDRLLDLPGTTTLTLESIDHSFTASSISK
jgi:hypothetical protein